MSRTGHIAEVFVSIQGEGIFVGVLQIFVRMAGCSRQCVYCDTPETRERPPRCTVRNTGWVRCLDNPVDVEQLVPLVSGMAQTHPEIHSVSVTGGEPLEQPEFLTGLLPRLRSLGLPVYLETNGLEEAACGAVARHVDIASIDIKLPSLCGGGDHFSTYRRVLPLFASAVLFAKVVVTAGVDENEFAEAVRIVAATDRSIPLVIQPAHSDAPGERISEQDLLQYHRIAAAHLDDVRVIPQCHRLLGIP